MDLGPNPSEMRFFGAEAPAGTPLFPVTALPRQFDDVERGDLRGTASSEPPAAGKKGRPKGSTNKNKDGTEPPRPRPPRTPVPARKKP